MRRGVTMKIVFASFVLAALVASVPSSASECRSPVACIGVSHAGPTELRASVTLAAGAAAGVLSIEEPASGPPAAIVVEWADGACGSDRSLNLYVNDVRFPIEAACAPGVRSERIDDAAGIARAWRENGPNVARLEQAGRDGSVAWARVRVGEGMASPSTCLFDVGGGACGTPRRPRTGALRGAFEVSATLADGRATSMRLREAFAGSRLPDSLDVSALSDGPHALCVASAGGSDCVTFTHLGEQTLVIQQPSGSTAPVANAGQGASAECASSSATPVTLDGSASTGAIVRYEWFENYGTASERSLGEGVVLQTTLPLGFHTITLKVTDPVGQTATAETERAIIDSIAPVVSFTTNPVSLWPADHRMVGVTVTPIVTDACSSPPLRLLSVTSNEPDDAPGDADGSTVGDVQGAVPGTDDRAFLLRAETGPVFGGRRYWIVYTAADGAGNTGVARRAVAVQVPRKPFVPVDDAEPVISLQRR